MRITLASGEVLADDGQSSPHRMNGLICCPGCGEVWARVLRNPKGIWYPFPRWCGKDEGCARAFNDCPGSLFSNIEHAGEELAHEGVLRHELEAQLKWAHHRPLWEQGRLEWNAPLGEKITTPAEVAAT